MSEIRHCEHSDWVVCDDCTRRAALIRMTEIDEEMGLYDAESLLTLAPSISEEDVERVVKILDAAHQDIWIKLKPKTLRSMATHIVEALTRRPADEVTRLREALAPSGDTKAAYHGEFAFDLYEGVSDAGIDQYRKVYVPWDTVKQIMAAIKARAALSSDRVKTDATPNARSE